MHSHLANLRPRRQSGSVLMIALLLVLIGTFGITAWFGLVAARSLEVNAKEDAVKRRVRLEGVKQVARQVASERFLAQDGGVATATVVSLPGGEGVVTFPAWSGTPYTQAAQLRYNQAGGVPQQSFSTDVVATLDDGEGTVGSLDYLVQMRSYVPAMHGDLLTIHEPSNPATAVTTDSNLLVNGRTVVWDGGNSLAHRTVRLCTSGHTSTMAPLNLSGAAVLPDNEAFASRSTGATFEGRLKAIDASESSANRYESRLAAAGYTSISQGSTEGDLALNGYHADGSSVDIDLDNASLPNLYIESRAHITLNGQLTSADYASAGSLPARLIVISDPAGTAAGTSIELNLIGENGRPIVVAIERSDRSNPLYAIYDNSAGGPSFPRWNLLLELEDANLQFLPGGSVSELHLVGGIRTDASIDTTALPVRLLQAAANPGWEAIASRAGFVEIFKN